jgi:hypothetical protein
MLTIIASIGFMLSVMTFIAGFRMVKSRGSRAERTVHRINGFLTITLYVIVAILSISKGTSAFYLFGWAVGMLVHIFKLFIVKKGLAARYGGYVGAMLLIVWLVVIFTHLPR